MRDFYDALVFDKKCVDFGKKLGYKQVLFEETAYCEPKSVKDIKPIKGKINFARGGELALNQAVVRKKGINVLLDPVGIKKEFDSAVAQIAKDRNIFIGISLRSILEAKNKARLLSNLSSMVDVCKKMRNDILFVSGAKDIYGMRSPLDLASIGSLIGLSKAQSLWSISEIPKALLEGYK